MKNKRGPKITHTNITLYEPKDVEVLDAAPGGELIFRDSPNWPPNIAVHIVFSDVKTLKKMLKVALKQLKQIERA